MCVPSIQLTNMLSVGVSISDYLPECNFLEGRVNNLLNCISRGAQHSVLSTVVIKMKIMIAANTYMAFLCTSYLQSYRVRQKFIAVHMEIYNIFINWPPAH